jgi:hypothetical protein
VPARNVQEPAVFCPSGSNSGQSTIPPKALEVEAGQQVGTFEDRVRQNPFFWRSKCSFSETMKEAAEPITFIRRARHYLPLRHSGWQIEICDRLS